MTREKLYDTAFRYKKAGLWKTLWDSEIFAIKLKNDKIGYVSIMGKNGEYNAMAVYIGDEGIGSYRLLFGLDPYTMPEYKYHEMIFKQNCLQVTFGSKDDLMPEEADEVRAYAKANGIRLAGKNEQGFGINLAWLNDIEIGDAYESVFAPKAWKNYIKKKKYAPLLSTVKASKKTKEEQLPKDEEKCRMLKCLHDFFIKKDRGYSFEQFGADIVESLDDAVVSIDVTRPYKDGGFDAIGRYKIFKNVDNSVFVEFYMQAKCYDRNNAVTVTDTARLISRIKNRQFGIMITTSYIADQAYKEVIDDGHPIVFINGKDIIDYIFNEYEIRSSEKLEKWLETNYGNGDSAFLETGGIIDYRMELEE